ncbi:pyruvate kinase [Mesoterricola silvestris]|uniref:Pyruvate kinase n=1 Tax=Mesoterricola silvestris TaxID=2927979 RepID=A0AA48GVC8_9BACT|nr:pyruvate kinase [Mesoterricola silvestris]BDU72511.1 pyruvate kinase [Mesoterricola silvestris]
MRKTKIVITMGPALAEAGRLRGALEIADAVRLNASHGDLGGRLEALTEIRRISGEIGRRVPVLLDLQGPKWRVGAMEAPQELPVGTIGVFHPDGEAPGTGPGGAAWAVPLPHPELFLGAKAGQRWILDDGNLEVEVTEVRPRLVAARVKVGGLLKPRKGVHPIGLDVAFDPLTPKDLVDIRWGVEHGVDLFAQSFVRRAEDVRSLEAVIKGLGGSQPIISKIEHPAALDNLHEILEASWGVMVARGDLGVELGVERVPNLQKHIIASARHALKPVITATQMLESMIESPQPTRAEASDVANAIWDGTDAVMLSAESAVGKFPVDAIQWLARIAADADAHFRPRLGRTEDALTQRLSSRTDVAVAFAACRTAQEIGASFIVVFTEGGGSARMVSRLAGDLPVVGVTMDLGNARRMGVMRGVQSLLLPKAQSADEAMATVEKALLKSFGALPGAKVVFTLGLPLYQEGTTNSLKVIEL